MKLKKVTKYLDGQKKELRKGQNLLKFHEIFRILLNSHNVRQDIQIT